MPPPRSILISAGEASGDYYAARLTAELQRRWPECRFFGCTGPKLRERGVESVIRAEDLAVVGLAEVVGHLPRIWLRFRKLISEARRREPDLAILTDSSGFHLPVAKKLNKQGVPIVYLIAPQVWAWRQYRVKTMRRTLRRVLCIFPFEEAFYQKHGVPVTYIGNPLVGQVRPQLTREEFFRKHNLPLDRPLVAVLPGSRRSEVLHHVPDLVRAANILSETRQLSFVLPASPNCGAEFFRQPLAGSRIQAIDGEAWDAMAYATVVLAASGTVTTEAALLGTPMVAFYRVTDLTYAIGKHLVDVPFFSMVNLIAEKRIIPELIQNDMSGESIAAAAARLLDNEVERAKMKEELAVVTARLAGSGDPMVKAADEVERVWEGLN